MIRLGNELRLASAVAYVRGRQLFMVDLTVGVFAILGAMVLRFDTLHFTQTILPYFPAALFPIIVRPPINVFAGLYRRAWAYASVGELIRITLTVAVGSLVGILLFYIVMVPLDVTGTVTAAGRFPRSFFVLEGLLALAGYGGVRFLIRVQAERRPSSAAGRAGSSGGLEARVPTLIYGAGEVGATVLRTIGQARGGLGMEVVGLVDDNRNKRGQILRGARVLGGVNELPAIAAATGARRLLIAMPMAPGAVVRRAVEEATNLGLETRTVPPLGDLVTGRATEAAIREVSVEDLLRREPVSIDEAGLREALAGRTVLVTGAGGSIGSELARQVFELDPRCLVLLDRAEGPLYDIERELSLLSSRDSGTPVRDGKARPRLETRLANVASRPTMRRIVAEDQPILVLHAAAYKHVPMMEHHPADAVYTNIGGTMAALEASVAQEVERFVLVSTDKAVHPASVMGATKRLAELAVAHIAAESGRPYVSVRFGNVLGSSGSVVPLFQRELAQGMPLTITDPEMTRFFMTIPEASRLILQAALFGRPADLFVLDMGEPVRILDLARDLARLAGRDPDSVPIQYIGLRPGEKVHEELFYEREEREPTTHPKVLRVTTPARTPADLWERLNTLVEIGAAGDHAVARAALFSTLAEVDP
jgi:FlaA1/EpsC-like NDP-sugar epimerase